MNIVDLSKIKFLIFDFDGVFTNNKVIVDENGKESVICDRSDGIGLSRAISGGLKACIVSTEVNKVVSSRGKKLNISVYQGVENKLQLIKELISRENFTPEETLFVGNDINDIPAMKYVGVSAGPADSYPEVKDICTLILTKNGGYGAVREICDMICNVKSIKSKYEQESF